MEEIIKELIEVIKQASKPDAFDYIITIFPIVISLIAVAISIGITYKQNKISLFEKRYKVEYPLRFILAAANTILSEKGNEKDTLRHIAESYFLANMEESMDFRNDIKILSFYHSLRFEILKSKYLFPKRLSSQINSLVTAFIIYVGDILNKKDTTESKAELKKEYEIFEKNKCQEKIDKYLKL